MINKADNNKIPEQADGISETGCIAGKPSDTQGPLTSDENETKLFDLESILQQVTEIDNSSDAAELGERMNGLLSSIGRYMEAKRAYIFEFIDDSLIFTNTYEWCADGVKSAMDGLQSLAPDDMPVWYKIFSAGGKIIIENLDDVRASMPSEYEILRVQDIKSEIAFPIIKKHRLMGFIGVDDPQIENSKRYINILSIAGWHLGAVWDSMHAEKLLEEKQSIIASSREALEKEKMFLEILCMDYTSVYYAELISDEAEVVEMEAGANAARFIGRGEHRMCRYSSSLRYYVDNYVIMDTTQRLDELLSAENLIKLLLKDNDRVTFRYRSLPNDTGHEYFEVQAIRVKKTDKVFRVMLGFRHIDDIVADEQRRHDELEKLVAETQLNNEIISAISKIYVSIFRIDLTNDHFDEVSSETEIHRLTGHQGLASVKMKDICDTLVAAEYRDRVRVFFDLSTLPERLADEETTAIEYLAEDGNWHLARFIVKKRDKDGRVTNVLYVTRIISDSKRREYNWIAIAEEANRENAAKTDFLSRMAHDIRTPMNAVMGFTAIAKHNIDNKRKVQEGLDGIERSGHYLQQIVDDVLDITRIESGNMKLFSEPSSIRDMFRDYEETAESARAERDLDIKFNIHDIRYDVLMLDPLRVKQIFINLISNAVKYTPDGGSVSVEVWEEEAHRTGRIRLIAVVRDTGIGMTPEFMKEMYGKFNRAVDTRVNKVRGSGLGLSVVKQLTELLGGTIEAKSRPGVGTSFRLSFEFEYTAEQKTEHENAAPPDIKESERLCRGMHLLLAEDNDLNFEVEKELMALYGITCERAEDGEVCVEKFINAEPYTYDAILMDMQMPVMDGIEATTAIRNLSYPNAKSIPIIALTANAFNADVQKCLKAGMNEHLSKPFDVKKLLRLLSTYRRAY